MLKSRFHKLVAAFAVFAVLGSLFAPAATAATSSKTITIHYHRYKGDYSTWNLWLWPANGGIKVVDGSQKDFSGTDAFGVVGTWTISATTSFSQIGIIPRKGAWVAKDIDKARFWSTFVSRR
jgi:pullulanase